MFYPFLGFGNGSAVFMQFSNISHEKIKSLPKDPVYYQTGQLYTQTETHGKRV